MKKILLIIIFLITCCTLEVTAAEISSEARVKAAYLYNFVKFIKWPKNTFKESSSPIIIGILGENALFEQLAPLNSRKVRNHPIEVKYFESMKEAQGCQLLYINIEETAQLIPVLDALKTSSTVTIGDYKDFASGGGIIQFATIRERLRFIINHDAAKKNNIQIDAQLLSLAIDVLEEN